MELLKKNANSKLIFMHIPKCGGTTFYRILDRMYLPEEVFQIKVLPNGKLNTEDFINLSVHEKDNLKLLRGHLQFGLHEHFSVDSKYITFLRSPTERIVSYYNFVKRTPAHFLYQNSDIDSDMSLFEFVTKIKVGDLNNGQIRYISGIQDKEEFMLEKALENIEKHFSFIGTIEKFNESLIFLQKMYNWTTPYYKVHNKNPERSKAGKLGEQVVEAIKYYNAGDIVLYEEINRQLAIKLTNEINLKQKLIWFKVISTAHYITKDAKNYFRLKATKLVPSDYKDALKRILH